MASRDAKLACHCNRIFLASTGTAPCRPSGWIFGYHRAVYWWMVSQHSVHVHLHPHSKEAPPPVGEGAPTARGPGEKPADKVQAVPVLAGFPSSNGVCASASGPRFMRITSSLLVYRYPYRPSGSCTRPG